ncbi:MAG TPA: LysR family transcriptional regulator [Novosphingobium sp.]|nr:LysR family transcriptional regulator [Novosphingobium sp.]
MSFKLPSILSCGSRLPGRTASGAVKYQYFDFFSQSIQMIGCQAIHRELTHLQAEMPQRSYRWHWSCGISTQVRRRREWRDAPERGKDMHFKGLDLNLLVVLDALLEEESVSRAAVRLNVSQPAVSAALAKLRWHTGDELLQKIGRTTRLTPRAQAMIRPLKEILIQVEATVKGTAQIDPSTFDRDFTISMTSYSAQVLLPDLVSRLLIAAPRVTCSVADIAADSLTRVKTGELDLCVTFLQTRLLNPRETLDELSHAPLFGDHWVMVAGNDNRRAGSAPDYKAFCHLPYIATCPGGVPSLAERVLDQLPNRPKPILNVETFDLAIANAIESECVTVVPSLMVGRRVRPFVRVMPTPFAMPEIEEFLVWHSRNDTEEGHRWFRSLLIESSTRFRQDSDE